MAVFSITLRRGNVARRAFDTSDHNFSYLRLGVSLS